MRDFRKYDVWKLSHELFLEIYRLSSSFPANERYGITSQLNRASLSIPTNISEGCGRDSDKDFNRFIQIAQGSAHEVEYILEVCQNLEFIELRVYEELNKKINHIKQKLYHLSKKLKE